MPQLDVGRREARCVVVYHGPRRAGKTETLQAIRHAVPPERRGDVLTRPSGVHPTLFLELLRLRPCRIGDLDLALDLVALPDHEALPALGELLAVTDGVVFVADAQAGRVDDDRAALGSLERALRRAGVDPGALPFAFQWNKRDLPAALPPAELARALGARGRPGFSSCAVSGHGVLQPLREVALAAARVIVPVAWGPVAWASAAWSADPRDASARARERGGLPGALPAFGARRSSARARTRGAA